MVVLAGPLSIGLMLWLRPWAAAMNTQEFSSAEGLAAIPVVTMLFATVAVVAQPWLKGSHVSARGTGLVRGTSTALGTAILLAPVLGGVFVPLLAGGDLLVTLAVGATLAVAEICALAWTLRLAPGRALRWHDPKLEQYRLRLGHGIYAAVVILCALGVAAFATVDPNWSAVHDLAAYGLIIVVVAPYVAAFEHLASDQVVPHRAKYQLGAIALVLIWLVASPTVGSLPVAALVSVLPLSLLPESTRRLAFDAHVRRLEEAGFGAQVRSTYGAHGGRQSDPRQS